MTRPLPPDWNERRAVVLERRLPRFGKSLAPWAVDIAFWLVYGGTAAVILYAVYCAPR